MTEASKKFPCDGCWNMAVARARGNDGRVDLWYEAYHREMHAQGQPDTNFSRSAR